MTRYNEVLLKSNLHICRTVVIHGGHVFPVAYIAKVVHLEIVRGGPLNTLKGSFNNVKSEIHGPTCYQCL